MLDFLHAFGCGIAFAGGIVVGLAASMLATARIRKETLAQSKLVFEKMAENVACQKRIAYVLELMAVNSQVKGGR